MKKIICICICIFLIFLSSGCGRLPNNGRPANDVVEGTGSEATPPLPSNTPVPEPSNTPAPTPEPQSSSGTSDTGSSVVKISLCVTAVTLFVIGVCYGGCRLLYRFTDIKQPTFVNDLKTFERVIGNYSVCYLKDGYYFDYDTDKYIDEIPVRVYDGKMYCLYYISNSSKLKLLKTWLRKKFRIKIPEGYTYRK